jgi:hypothetical protein
MFYFIRIMINESQPADIGEYVVGCKGNFGYKEGGRRSNRRMIKMHNEERHDR